MANVPQAVFNNTLGGFGGSSSYAIAESLGWITKPFGQPSVPPPSAGLYADFPDCANGPLKHNLVCNYSAPWLDRAKAVVDLFTPDELAANSGNTSPGVPRLGLPRFELWGEALHGLAYCPAVHFERDGEWAYGTSFPQPINLGSAFDDDMVHQVATFVSTEARAFSNGKHAGTNFWTPNINPFRDPRWGRGQEVPGEDAFHLSRYVYALITGLQGPDVPNHYKVVASCKHYAGYDVDEWNGMDRFHFDAQISTQDLAEYHMLPFRSCVRDAQVGSIMCSYNSVNGIPTCANPYFLQDILREEWGFGEGWVTGDCDAVLHIWMSHHYVPRDQASAVALKAGTDSDCGRISQETLKNALDQGMITQDDLKKALTRIYGSFVRTGYFDPPNKKKYHHLGWKDVNTPEAQALALHAAEAGIVLLKNDGILPLAAGKYKKVALIGPLGDAHQEMQDDPLQGFKDAGFDVTFHKGTDGIQGDNKDGFESAISAAKKADIIFFAGGINNEIEAEAYDRMSIVYPSSQLELLRKLQKLGKPVVVLQFGGGQVDDTELKENDAVNAIIWAGYPGQSGGTALANIITGKVAPAARLSTTQYRGDFIELPMTDMNLRPTDESPGRTYKWYTGDAVYPFGHGLHYTTFEFAWAEDVPGTLDIPSVTAQKTRKHLDLETLHTFKVAITNTGRVTSDYAALLFVKSTAGPQPAPLKSLIGYARAKKIEPGATSTIDIVVSIGAISRADEKGSFLLSPGKYELELDAYGVLRGSFNLTGDVTSVLDFPQPRD